MTREALAPLLVSILVATGLATQMTDSAPPSLSPCPSTPNCVSSFDEEPSRALPPLVYELPEKEVMARIRELVEANARARVVAETPRYLHAEYRSLVFRFVDDVEFALDSEKKMIHFRSASRTGSFDWGVNRRRMERFRQRLAEREGITTVPAPLKER